MKQVGTLPNYSSYLANTLPQGNVQIPEQNHTARVVDVILGPSHPSWSFYGYSQARYGVFYKEMFAGSDNKVNFAYCKNSCYKRIPIKDEIVTLVTDFAGDLSVENERANISKVYWDSIIGVWNQPDFNNIPYSDEDDPEDRPTANPLQLCQGDTVIEGRYGESIRFGGAEGDGSKIATKESKDKPYIQIRVGQGERPAEGDVAIYENINKDSSSIYITSNHRVDLEEAIPANTTTAWPDIVKPIPTRNFQGPQIVSNTDRIIQNARKDIRLIAKEGVELRGGKVALNAREAVGIDGKTIYIGGPLSRSENERMVLGDSLVGQLTTLYDNLGTLVEALANTSDTTPWKAQVIAAANSLKDPIKKTKAGLGKIILSKKTFVE